MYVLYCYHGFIDATYVRGIYEHLPFKRPANCFINLPLFFVPKFACKQCNHLQESAWEASTLLSIFNDSKVDTFYDFFFNMKNMFRYTSQSHIYICFQLILSKSHAVIKLTVSILFIKRFLSILPFL